MACGRRCCVGCSYRCTNAICQRCAGAISRLVGRTVQCNGAANRAHFPGRACGVRLVHTNWTIVPGLRTVPINQSHIYAAKWVDMESDKTTYRCNAQTGHCRRRRRSGAEHRTATATRRRRAALQTKVAKATNYHSGERARATVHHRVSQCVIGREHGRVATSPRLVHANVAIVAGLSIARTTGPAIHSLNRRRGAAIAYRCHALQAGRGPVVGRTDHRLAAA
jgi:hypothetical protein